MVRDLKTEHGDGLDELGAQGGGLRWGVRRGCRGGGAGMGK